MSTVYSTKVGQATISIIKSNDWKSNEFAGRKLKHLAEFDDVEHKLPNGKTVTKKQYTKLLELDLSTAKFYVKHDGQCGLLYYNNATDSIIPMTRINLKRHKKTHKFPKPKDTWVPCEPMPSNDGQHWPHMHVLDAKQDKHLVAAMKKLDVHTLTNLVAGKHSIPVEYMGQKVQNISFDQFEDNCVIVPHNCLEVIIPNNLKTFEGFEQICKAIPFMEGLIVYLKDGQIFKIRRGLFKGLSWPTKKKEYDVTKCNFVRVEDGINKGLSYGMQLK